MVTVEAYISWLMVPLIIMANRHGIFCEEVIIFSEEQGGFRRERSASDMMFVGVEGRRRVRGFGSRYGECCARTTVA